MRWMRVVERDGDTNEDAGRRKDVEEGEEEEAEKEGKRRERKEGVRVRVRLGVGGAIRNYCGTIDKRRLRGRTTEDSLWPSDFPSTVASPPLFRFSLFPGSFRLPHSRHAVLSVPVSCPRNLPDSSICNVREPAPALRHPRPAVLRGIEDSIRFCIFQWTRRANRGGTQGRPCKYTILDDS